MNSTGRELTVAMGNTRQDHRKGVEKATERESEQGKKHLNAINNGDPMYTPMKISCMQNQSTKPTKPNQQPKKRKVVTTLSWDLKGIRMSGASPP